MSQPHCDLDFCIAGLEFGMKVDRRGPCATSRQGLYMAPGTPENPHEKPDIRGSDLLHCSSPCVFGLQALFAMCPEGPCSS